MNWPRTKPPNDVETLVSTRLDPGVDPIQEADKMGTIMAVLRIGNMDLEMPGIDRWESVRRPKNDTQTRDIPIIGMSAYALDSEREEAITTGCDEFDAKPIDFVSLLATIRRVVAKPK